MLRRRRPRWQRGRPTNAGPPQGSFRTTSRRRGRRGSRQQRGRRHAPPAAARVEVARRVLKPPPLGHRPRQRGGGRRPPVAGTLAQPPFHPLAKPLTKTSDEPSFQRTTVAGAGAGATTPAAATTTITEAVAPVVHGVAAGRAHRGRRRAAVPKKGKKYTNSEDWGEDTARRGCEKCPKCSAPQ